MTGEDLAKDKGRRADNVESNDDQGELDTLDLGSGDDYWGGPEQCNIYVINMQYIYHRDLLTEINNLCR